MLGYNELLKDKCSYEHYISTNKYNEKSYSEPVEIKCFLSDDLSNVRVVDEQTVTLNKKVFIGNEFKPHEFDKIDNLEIKQIKPVKGILTKIIGWEVVV